MVKIMSYNVRWDNPADGQDGWAHRKDVVASIIQKHQPVLFGLQVRAVHCAVHFGAESADHGRSPRPAC